jgi:lysylphosphatidylglycerol synthetase-like protein (DUF2156 family)
MRLDSLPVAAVVLACAWCAAEITDLTALAVGFSVIAVGATAAVAGRRRSGNGFWLVVVVVMVLLALVIGLLLIPGGSGWIGLVIQVAAMLLLAPLIPVLYALSFPDGPGGGAS